MKVQMMNWGYLKDLPEWFKDGEELDVTLDQVAELIAMKYQVMIKRWNGSDKVMLCVDKYSFRQH